jgi:hypothetical protein
MLEAEDSRGPGGRSLEASWPTEPTAGRSIKRNEENMRILGTLAGVVLFFGGVGLIFHGVFGGQPTPALQPHYINVVEAVIGGILLLTAMGLAVAIGTARENAIIDRLRGDD